jgi:hypothetical protein
MNSDFLKDIEIQNLISELKPFKFEFSTFLSKAKEKLGHKENDFIIDRQDGSKFRIMVRQSISNPLDFSIILGYYKPNSNLLIRLKRYNGKSHEHQNKIEKTDKFYDFHIHIATERYQNTSQYKPEHYAEITERYSDIHSAWLCFAQDCNITYPNSNNQQLF